jgi:hypothetical protein
VGAVSVAEEPANPFGELNQDVRDRLPVPKSTGQAAYALIGFLVMGLGGGLVGCGAFNWLIGSPLVILGVPGLGISYLGYWLFLRSRGRTRRAHRANRPNTDL